MFKYFEDKRLKKEAAAAEQARKDAELHDALVFKTEYEGKLAKDELDKIVLMESDVPYYKLIGEQYTSLHTGVFDPVVERYIWNKAFIKSLQKQGYGGESDSEIIHAWEVAEDAKRIATTLAVEKTRRYDSPEPWVEIVSDSYDPELRQVRIKLDWNKAFIVMLRKNGYTGRDDQELVDKYFKSISESIAQDMHGEKFDG